MPFEFLILLPRWSESLELVHGFLTNEPLPGAELEQALNQQYLPAITHQEINALARAWFTDRNRFVVLTARV
jgi:hypothetical protein